MQIYMQVKEISERLENVGARVNIQAAQWTSQLKLHGDKLAAKVNIVEEERQGYFAEPRLHNAERRTQNDSLTK